MPVYVPPPAHPDLKRELKQHLLSLSARSFEFFAGEFLIYAGLEAVSVTRYIGDGGIDALGELVAGRFRIPIGIQVKRHRQNVQRPDIDRFVGALSGRFSDGMFMTTANYAPRALQKAATSIPRILTLNGEQIVSIMIEHNLGLTLSVRNGQKQDIDPDYFAAFEARRHLLSGHLRERSLNAAERGASPIADDQTIDLKPEEDLLSLNALGYALRVDPARVRRWIEHGALLPDALQTSGGRAMYYLRRDRIEQIRQSLSLQSMPESSDEWKQEFLDFVKSKRLSKSYKPVMLKVFFQLADREGRVQLDDLVTEFRNFYLQHIQAGRPLEQSSSLMADPLNASDLEIKKLIITHPLERFLIKNFIEYSPAEGALRIAPQLWQELRHYEVIDALTSADEQIRYYLARPNREGKTTV
jgi:hypothetical protein